MAKVESADVGIGVAVPRVEDARFLRGLGRYTDDIRLPDMAHMAIVRSPHAHARILSIDSGSAVEMPGVLAVLTGQDLESDGIGVIDTVVQRHRRDGSPMPRPPFRALALHEVKLVGEPVAIVIAESLLAAQDAAELVRVEYEILPSVTDAAEALRPGAPAVWAALAPNNECFHFELGNRSAVDAAFAKAAHVSRLDFRISRISANPMEPRNAIGAYDQAEDSYTLYAGTQAPHNIRTEIADKSLRIPGHRLRVVSSDVGGGFGMKGSVFPEYLLVLWGARRVARPVHWNATRSESFVSDFHARDNHSSVELALDDQGHFLGLRIRTIANLGAYLGFNTPHSSTNNLGGLAGVYRTPHIHADVVGVFTNTPPNAPYRGAGRPEATYAIERVIDMAASEMGIDRVELRRRNLIARSEMPFKTGLVFEYDSGNFAANMDLALARSDWSGFAARRESSRRQGKLRGLGIANAIEIAAGPFRRPGEEFAEIRFDSTGAATILLGSHNHGQGHETAFRQLAHSWLGLAFEDIRIVEGDTGMVAHGRGTFGSRSMAAGGTALLGAAEQIIEKARKIAAHLLEADTSDIRFEAGRFTVAGTDRSVTLKQVARTSYVAGSLPAGASYGLSATNVAMSKEATFPNGCHVCEVEIDEETGVTEVVSYVVVDDVGTVINPTLLKGQIHGGVAQGLGQALGERIHYDADGQIITGSFMDYAMPRASDMPFVDVLSNPDPTGNNPLGVKGAGEAGTVGALAAIMNAVADALAPLGIRHVDMPADPASIWHAIRSRKP